MRLLIMGGSGMVGHRMWLAAQGRHATWATIRAPLQSQPWAQLFDAERVVQGVTVDDASSFDRAFEIVQPEVVVNALGLIKQRPGGMSPGEAFMANSFVPHYVRKLCDARGARLIQISTDCVFVGDRGNYSEAAVPDAVDIYGLSKRLGEVGSPHLTLRTSAIGRSLHGSDGLVEWFLAQTGTIRGFRSALFSGLVTNDLADTVMSVIGQHRDLAGVWHVAAPAIDKYSLLVKLREAYNRDVEIEPVDEPRIDRTLDDTRFRTATGIAQPTWDAMIQRMADDPTPYEKLRA